VNALNISKLLKLKDTVNSFKKLTYVAGRVAQTKKKILSPKGTATPIRRKNTRHSSLRVLD
jgi:hypothetical protein